MELIEAEKLIEELIKKVESEGIDHYTVVDDRKGGQRYKNISISIKIK